MKKTIRILALALIIVMLTVSFAGCFVIKTTDKNYTTAPATTGEAEVSLIGVSADTKLPATKNSAFKMVSVPRLLAAPQAETAETTEVTTVAETTAEPVEDDAYSTFTVIYKTQTVIYFTINLSNPNNRYIMDFKLSCDEDPNVTVRQGTHESRINDPNTYIRWDEAEDRIGNHQATFVLTLPDTTVSPTSIRISEMYYSDRTDGVNKTTVNMNNRDVYTIYKTDSLVETTARRNSLEYFEFGLNVNEKATVTSVKVDGVEQTANGEGKYQIPSGKLVIEYDFIPTDGVVYKGSYEEDIEVLRFERTNTINKVNYSDAHFYIFYNIIGTDFSYSNIRVKDFNIELLQTFEDGFNIGLAEYPSIQQYKPNLTLIICGTEFVVADTFE